jgi:YceI-like domain
VTVVARYRIVPERSHVWIDARSNVHPIHSSTDGLEGFVELEWDQDGHVDLGTEPKGQLSLAVTKLASGNRLEDREMQKRIDARRYPTIEGVLGGIEQSGSDGAYHVTGDVTFRGVTRRCDDQMTIKAVDADTVQLAGESQFNIRDYGMEPPRVLMLRVEPDVKVRVEIVAEKES